MKYWFDTEFIEDGKTIDLVSIGIVAEDGRELYEVSNEFNEFKADHWVMENVICKLEPHSDKPRKTRKDIALEVLKFIGTDKPEIWAYYADYDWVVLCQLFGRMIDLPKGWPMFCLDIKQLAWSKGNPALPKQEKGHHNALADARWNRAAWDFLAGSDVH